MFDGSSLSLDENVAQTAQVVEIAHKVGVTVEGEVGTIGMTDEFGAELENAHLSDPDSAERLANTGIGCIAVAIGNAHGFYEGTPELRFDLRRGDPQADLDPDGAPGMDIARDMEVFGPVWPIIGFDSLDEAVQIHNNSTYGLGGGIMAPDMKTALQVARKLKTGHVAINASGGFRAAELPFGGGQKASGNSRESMSAVMHEVTQTKSIILRYVFNEGHLPTGEGPLVA